jgi:hypothetical protein
VLVAVFTSQAAGAWLEHVLGRGWPLLKESAQQSALSIRPTSGPPAKVTDAA